MFPVTYQPFAAVPRAPYLWMSLPVDICRWHLKNNFKSEWNLLILFKNMLLLSLDQKTFIINNDMQNSVCPTVIYIPLSLNRIFLSRWNHISFLSNFFSLSFENISFPCGRWLKTQQTTSLWIFPLPYISCSTTFSKTHRQTRDLHFWKGLDLV